MERQSKNKVKKKGNPSQKPSCGIICPISEDVGKIYTTEHWVHIQGIIKESLESCFRVQMVSESEDAGVITNRIIKNLYASDMIVCDISNLNPNVMFELGIRIAFDKPFIIIIDENTQAPFDTSHIEYISYPANLNYPKILEFKENLKNKVNATFEKSKGGNYSFLREFGNFNPFHFDDKNMSEQDKFTELLGIIGAKMDGLRREVMMTREMSEQLYRRSRFRDIIPMNKETRLIRQLCAQDSFRKDAQALGLEKIAEKLKTVFKEELGTLPDGAIIELLKRHLPDDMSVS